MIPTASAALRRQVVRTSVAIPRRPLSTSSWLRPLSSPAIALSDDDNDNDAPPPSPSPLRDAVRAAADAHISRRAHAVGTNTWLAEDCDDERPTVLSVSPAAFAPGHVDGRVAPPVPAPDADSFLPRRSVDEVPPPSSLYGLERVVGGTPLRSVGCTSWTDAAGKEVAIAPLAKADPFVLAAPAIAAMDASMADLVGSDHPLLSRLASYFLDPDPSAGGKKLRPTMVLLLAEALSDAHPSLEVRPDLAGASARLAEIAELIHTASLYHDDVIDRGSVRRGRPALHGIHGNKAAILGGDFLLARASVCLARLRCCAVVECMSTVVEHLVRGEVMQLVGAHEAGNDSGKRLEGAMGKYLHKNFYKTASLMANSCRSAALLGKYPQSDVDRSYAYGKHAGLAFQLVDDVLDFEDGTGKEKYADLRSGLATAPVLYAAEAHPELWEMIGRRFGDEGDAERAAAMVEDSDGVERTNMLARAHIELAVDAVVGIGGGAVGEGRTFQHRDALVHLAYKMVRRTR